MMVYVKHRGSDPRWKGNRIEYWKENSGKCVPTICPCCGSNMNVNGGPVGAHVVRVTEPRGQVFITPTCKQCNDTYKNTKTDEIHFFVDEAMLVPANEEKLDEQEQSDDCIDDDLYRLAGIKKEDLK